MSNFLLNVSTWCVIDISIDVIKCEFLIFLIPTPDPPTVFPFLYYSNWKWWGLPWLFSFSLAPQTNLWFYIQKSSLLHWLWATILILATIISCLIYCPRLIIGVLAFSLILYSCFSTQARVIFQKRRSCHYSLKTLQQLPVSLRSRPKLTPVTC